MKKASTQSQKHSNVYETTLTSASKLSAEIIEEKVLSFKIHKRSSQHVYFIVSNIIYMNKYYKLFDYNDIKLHYLFHIV